jgi:anaerobic selenocysteine-containing dehydrogenase
MKRREFIILSSVGATSTALLSACGHPENKLIPALIPDNEYVPGLDYWKASACTMCAAGCGIVVRTREHKANKIEGNPLHPVNRGALCARGQAGLQVLYNPDRIRSPLKRTGERGSGQFAEISWDEAIKTLADKLREIKPQGHQQRPLFITGETDGITPHVAARLMQACGGNAVLAQSLFDEVIGAGNDYFGAVFDIANATYLLSFGARFLETWRSPVMYSLAYGEFRRSTGKARGKFVHIEPRMSLTAANADEWVPATIRTEGLVALAIAQVIIREGLNKTSVSSEFVKVLEDYAPEKTTARVDVSADKLIRIAREFATAERPVAIGSGNQATMDWINFLNTLAGNLGKKGGVILTQPDGFDPLEKLRPVERAGRMGQSQLPDILNVAPAVLLIHQFNPLYITPSALEKTDPALFIASFSSVMDETMQMADLILPAHSPLESWNLHSRYPTAGSMVATLTQPVVSPEFNTRQTVDVLLALSRELGGAAAAALPYKSAEEIVRQAAADLAKHPGSIKAEKPEDFWKTLTERGVWIGEAVNKPEAVSQLPDVWPSHTTSLNVMSRLKAQQATANENPLTLMVYEHPALGDGEFANLPALQELPDPMTNVIWGSWVEINPKTAAALGIADGDLVEVITEHRSVRAPAVVYPAIRPDVIAMPLGQGHTAYGQYATGRGANAALLLAPVIYGYPPELSIAANVAKVAGTAKLIRFGSDLWQQMETKR